MGGRDCIVEGSASESAKGAAEPHIYRVLDNRINEVLLRIVSDTMNLLFIYIPAENSFITDGRR